MSMPCILDISQGSFVCFFFFWGDTKRPFLAQAWKLRAGTARHSEPPNDRIQKGCLRAVDKIPHQTPPQKVSGWSWKPCVPKHPQLTHGIEEKGLLPPVVQPAGPPMVSSRFPPGRKSLMLTAVRARRRTPRGKSQVRSTLVCTKRGPGSLAAQEFRR